MPEKRKQVETSVLESYFPSFSSYLLAKHVIRHPVETGTLCPNKLLIFNYHATMAKFTGMLLHCPATRGYKNMQSDKTMTTRRYWTFMVQFKCRCHIVLGLKI